MVYVSSTPWILSPPGGHAGPFDVTFPCSQYPPPPSRCHCTAIAGPRLNEASTPTKRPTCSKRQMLTSPWAHHQSHAHVLHARWSQIIPLSCHSSVPPLKTLLWSNGWYDILHHQPSTHALSTPPLHVRTPSCNLSHGWFETESSWYTGLSTNTLAGTSAKRSACCTLGVIKKSCMVNQWLGAIAWW